MNTKHLAVSEIFGPTFQGEGPSTGRRAFFLRLAGCNLTCSWCDTKYTWDWTNYNPRSEVRMMSIEQVFEELLGLGYNYTDLLVITGGEPMLQQERVLQLLKTIRSGPVEIETNGTIVPNEEMLHRRVAFNVSPKLAHANTKPTEHKALKVFAEYSRARFKFVVQRPEDLLSVQTILDTLPRTIPNYRIWIMPEGVTTAQLEERMSWLPEEVLRRGWCLTNRLHVMLWQGVRSR